MQAKGAELINNGDTVTLEFNNVTLGHRRAVDFAVRFLNNKAYEAVFLFKADDDPKTIEYYKALVADINEIYGKGKENRIFRTTFSDGDGYELTAIETGNADYFTNWRDNSTKNLIQAMIDSKLNVYLFYIDQSLSDEATAKEKAKEKNDY